MDKIEWPRMGASEPAPSWYKDCFRNALRRVSVLLNQTGSYTACSHVKLDCSETALEEIFRARNWDRELVQFHVAIPDDYANEDEYSAEYFFYSDVSFPLRNGQRISKFTVPQPFLDWSFRRLHQPDGDNASLNLSEFSSGVKSPDFIRHCAANYLVKNFWHNFIHRAVQGISGANYHEFRGPAREDSDFEADHLANLLLVRAFGLPLKTNGRISEEIQSRIEALFRRNRCNLVFAERAQHRASDRASMSREERWAELEWRFCRSVANAVSSALISHGLAASSVRIFLNGKVRSADYRGVIKTWRTGEVIVEIAGRRISTQVPAYIPDDELRAEISGKRLDARRQKAMHHFRGKREREIVAVALASYKTLIRNDRLLCESVKATLTALGNRLSIPLL